MGDRVSCRPYFLYQVNRISPNLISLISYRYEANSQILNGCFTLMAFITQPYRAYLAYWTWKWHTSPSLDEKREWAAKIKKSMPDIILHPCNLNTTVPLSSSSPPPPTSRNTTPPTRNASDADIEVVVVASATVLDPQKPTNPLDATPPKTWLSILLLLNLNCIFQYPIAIAMWMYIGQAYARPPWIIGLFLPLSFLCGFASGLWPALHGSARKKRMMAGGVDGDQQVRGSTNTANNVGL